MKKLVLVIIGILIIIWTYGKLDSDPIEELEGKLREAEGALRIDTIRRDLLAKEYQEALGIKTKIVTNLVTLKNEATEL